MMIWSESLNAAVFWRRSESFKVLPSCSDRRRVFSDTCTIVSITQCANALFSLPAEKLKFCTADCLFGLTPGHIFIFEPNGTLENWVCFVSFFTLEGSDAPSGSSQRFSGLHLLARQHILDSEPRRRNGEMNFSEDYYQVMRKNLPWPPV